MKSKANFKSYEDGSYINNILQYRPHFLDFRDWMKKSLGVEPINDYDPYGYESIEDEKLTQQAYDKHYENVKKLLLEFGLSKHLVE